MTHTTGPMQDACHKHGILYYGHYAFAGRFTLVIPLRLL